eukprot:358440-Chlamydomonas_euryale.AAC.3
MLFGPLLPHALTKSWLERCGQCHAHSPNPGEKGVDSATHTHQSLAKRCGQCHAHSPNPG